MNLPFFLFINGPAGSGKDTLAKLIAAAEPGAYIESFAEPIRSMIYSVFFPNDGPITYTHDLRDQKVKASPMPYPAFDAYYHTKEQKHYTIRQEMIAFSEEYMKRRYGPMVFGKLLWDRVQEQAMFSKHFLIADSGFVPEAEYLISKVGPQNCALIRLHREGCTYSGDSRGYIELSDVTAIDMQNNGSLDDLLQQVKVAFSSPLSAL